MDNLSCAKKDFKEAQRVRKAGVHFSAGHRADLFVLQEGDVLSVPVWHDNFSMVIVEPDLKN